MISSLARWTQRLGVVGVALALAGPLVAYLGITPPFGGFLILGVGLLVSVGALVIGLLALVRGPGPSRAVAGRGMALAGLVLAAALLGAGQGRDVPRINDITTDTANPPRFVHAPTMPANTGRDMGYPGESFARQQREGYGDLEALTLALPADQAWARVLAAARETEGWEITREDPGARALEGIDTSRLFRFRDDFVIEVREDGAQSIVHMRSKSRDGQSDLGVNAARIHAFFERVRAGE